VKLLAPYVEDRVYFFEASVAVEERLGARASGAVHNLILTKDLPQSSVVTSNCLDLICCQSIQVEHQLEGNA
jgi:hypothetical protein